MKEELKAAKAEVKSGRGDFGISSPRLLALISGPWKKTQKLTSGRGRLFGTQKYFPKTDCFNKVFKHTEYISLKSCDVLVYKGSER